MRMSPHARWLCLVSGLAACAHGSPARPSEYERQEPSPPAPAQPAGEPAASEAPETRPEAPTQPPTTPPPEAKEEPQQGRQAGRGSVTVEMLGFRNAQGQVLVALWRKARGFPEEGGRAEHKKVTQVRGRSARVVFDDLPPGPFAVVAHHDADKDFEMATNMFGIPQEGYGFSRNARGSMGPPSFQDARLVLKSGERETVRIQMVY